MFAGSYKECKILTLILISVCQCSIVVGLQGQVNATQTDIGVVFNKTVPIAELPQNDSVAQTLVDALKSNETFSVTVKASSVQVICK